MAFAIVFIAYKFRFELRDEIVNLIVEQLKAHVNNRIQSFDKGIVVIYTVFLVKSQL